MSLILTLALLTSATTAADQVAEVQQSAQVVEVATSPNGIAVLRAGTEVPLMMREELTTKKKKLKVGQRFQMEVASNVMAGTVIVLPAGTPVVGEITEVRNKGMWGKSGYIGARAVSANLGGRNIRLTGTFDDKGVTGTGGVVAAVAFIPIAGFFTTGTSAVIPMGGHVKAFLDEDIHYRVAPTAPAVMTVPAAVQ